MTKLGRMRVAQQIAQRRERAATLEEVTEIVVAVTRIMGTKRIARALGYVRHEARNPPNFIVRAWRAWRLS